MDPNPDVAVLVLDHNPTTPTNPTQGTDSMPVDDGNMNVALTAMANGMASLANEMNGAAARRMEAADQLANDSQRMWSIAMTTPTVTAAHAMRVASESGAGRTRVEANSPADSQIVGKTA